MNIHDYFAGRRPWAQLERILVRLPKHSYYKAALDDDVEFAKIALLHSIPDTQRRNSVPLVGYSELHARLDNVYDAVVNVAEILLAVHSKNKPVPGKRGAPRPETAYQRLRRQQKIHQLDEIVERMTGGK